MNNTNYKNAVYVLAILFVTVFRMVLDAVHVLVPLFASGHGTRKRLLVGRTIAHRSRMSNSEHTEITVNTHIRKNALCFTYLLP